MSRAPASLGGSPRERVRRHTGATATRPWLGCDRVTQDPAEQPTLTDGTVTLRGVARGRRRGGGGRARRADRPLVRLDRGRRHAERARRRRALASRVRRRPRGGQLRGRRDGDGWSAASSYAGRRSGVGELSWASYAGSVAAGWPPAPCGAGGLRPHRTGQGGSGCTGSRPGRAGQRRVAAGRHLGRPAPRGRDARRPGTGDRAETATVVFARLASDPPRTEPQGFRALLNSFLPRKRAISQMLVRDDDGRVLLCQLTYKQDWDLPGGVVEVGESPQLAVAREVEEELGLAIARRRPAAHRLAAAVGRLGRRAVPGLRRRHPRPGDPRPASSSRPARSGRREFCTLERGRERCADFTARRIAAALAAPRRPGAAGVHRVAEPDARLEALPNRRGIGYRMRR